MEIARERRGADLVLPEIPKGDVGTDLVFRRLRERGHEQLLTFNLREFDVIAYLAIHDTTLGPALGGIRFSRYPTENEAAVDALSLSEGMTYKAALAGLPLGGGKMVIQARRALSPEEREDLFFEIGKRIKSQANGIYIPAEDAGTTVIDMAAVLRSYPLVTGRQELSGDPSPVTARGVFQGILATVLASPDLGFDSVAGLRVAIQGVGHVGGPLARMLHQAGAKLIIADTSQEAVDRIVQETGVTVVAPDKIYDVECDVWTPCALSEAINLDTVYRIKAPVIAGAANVQLSDPRMAGILQQRGILWAPDFVINAGGLINVASELPHVLHGKPFEYREDEVFSDVDRIGERLTSIFAEAESSGRLPGEIALEQAQGIIAAARAAA